MSASRPRTPAGDGLGRAVEVGLDVVDAVRRARDPARSWEKEHKRQVAFHAKALRRYRRRLELWRAQMWVGTGVAAGGTALVIYDVAAAPYGWGLLGAVAALAGGSSALGAHRRLREAVAPEVPLLVAPPPPALPRGAAGAQEAEELAVLRRRLAELAPAVTVLHPQAGRELLLADAAAAPAMAALVERLGVLDRLSRDLPSAGGSAPAVAATAAQEVRARLASGVTTYDHLVAAAAAMLAAPDLAAPAEELLRPAIDALAAYTHGLGASARAFGPPAVED